MNSLKAYEQYIEKSSVTAAPGELLVMLFNAEIKNIRAAILKINSKNLQEAHQKLIRAQAIIDELILSLDYSYEISKSLSELYSFIKRELVEANIKKDTQKLEGLLPVLAELRDTWQKANYLIKVSC